MGIIKVRTPNGVQQVRIAGDSPTDLEQKAIISQFYPEKAKEMAAMTPPPPTTAPEIDLATASAEEIREYTAALKAAGVNPITMQPLTEAEKNEYNDNLKDEDVDYTSGVRNLSLRMGVSNKEKLEEKAAYLKDKVGADGFRTDKGGRLILTKKGRERLGLGDGPEVAIDEEGISRYDVADFVGEAGLPLGVGIVAGFLTAGTGTLPAMIAVGTAMGLGKVADEAIESAQGYQRQTKEEITRDAIFEAGMGFLGEGVGRFISGIAGRFLKGSPSKAAEEAKKGGRRAIERGYLPTVEGAAPGAFSILSRVQAVYEGVIPNKKAAQQNINQAMKDLRDLGMVNEKDLSNLNRLLKKDVEQIYAESGEAVTEARRVMNEEIEVELAKIIAPLKKDLDLPKEALKTLQTSKELFKEQVDQLYKMANDKFGKGNKIIPLGKLQELLDDQIITKEMKGIFEKKGISDIFQSARTEAIKRLESTKYEPGFFAKLRSTKGKSKEQIQEDRVLYNQLIRKEMYVTPQQANALRHTMTEMNYDPRFAQTLKANDFGVLREELNFAFLDAEDKLDLAIRTIDGLSKDLPKGSKLKAKLTDTLKIEGDINELKEGVALLRETGEFYADGIGRFDETITQKIFKETRGGRKKMNPSRVLNYVVKNDDPDTLEKFLKETRGVPRVPGVAVEEPKVRFNEVEYSIDEAEELLRPFVKVDPITGKTKIDPRGKNLNARIQKAKSKREQRQDILDQGGRQSEEMRKQLASAWINRLMKQNLKVKNLKDGEFVFDGIKIQREIEKLGKTKDILFKSRLKGEGEKGELDDLNDLLRLFRSTGAEVNEETMQEFASRPLAQAIKGLKDKLEIEKNVTDNDLLRSLSRADADDIVDKIFRKKSPNRIRQFMNNKIKVGDSVQELPNHEALSNKVKDAAMGRILRSVTDVNSSSFGDDFLSGKVGKDLLNSLDGYGRESVEAMFGKKEADSLYELAEIMIRSSDAPMSGKGGLAAPTIALGLTVFGVLTAPMATLPALGYYTFMSMALRKPGVLKLITTTREPGADTVSAALRDIQTAIQKTNLELGTTQEGVAQLSPEQKEKMRNVVSPVSQFISQKVPNVTSAFAGTQAANVDPTNPIVNPNPQSQALAQALASR
jgi:hypothetical protein